MTMTRTIKRLKQDASYLKKKNNIALNQALNLVAKQHGYEDWQDLSKSAIDGKVIITTSDSEVEESQEETLNQQNRELLAEYGIDFSVLTITATGIQKSIMDAIGSLRNFFDENDFHSYEQQEQGEEYKVIKTCALITPEKILDKEVSLYRPTTKNGDPRIWIYGLKPFVEPDDELAFFIIDNQLYVLNLNLVDLSHYSDLLFKLEQSLDEVAIELRDKLIEIAKQPLKAIMKGDTAIGMTVEHALDLPANSSKKPDYKGIELKSGRVTKSKTRSNLFAQVPAWDKSVIKSSRKIVDTYGYLDQDNGDQRLYCTVSALGFNNQGLRLKVDFENDRVYEEHEVYGEVVIWEGQKLRERLLEKHQETFWISAAVKKINDDEFYSLEKFTHTKNPMAHQLLPLIDQGIITLDHLIKRKNKTGRTSEKGPFFKIRPENLIMLFPDPVVYSLVEA
ncbi:MvaI/BcnI family restriction endonuclease [uncultured Psychrobacter sp.]|uniref:MvaI/BcnI family restriction endonuclease n=1 Tax=uncultured Psychrobacter sp. TaxID=259303 RepID=UPI0026204F3A|nr:MvaI/BcnI family restriction endonuclease [uncultured Psychrobacter sp.]